MTILECFGSRKRKQIDKATMHVPLFRAEAATDEDNGDIFLNEDLAPSDDEDDEDEIIDNIKGQLERLQAVLDRRAASL